MLNHFRKKILLLMLLSMIAALPACKDHPENKANKGSVLVSKKIPAVQKKVPKAVIGKKPLLVATAKKAHITAGTGLKDNSVSNKTGELSHGKQAVPVLDEKQQFYSSEGKIDPFDPLIKAEHKKEALAAVPGGEEKKPQLILTPLMKLDFSQMRLVAIVMAESGNIAMVEDSTNKGYAIRTGTYMGKNGGRVVKIDKDKVIIMEHIKNFKGEIVNRSKILKLHKPDNEG